MTSAVAIFAATHSNVPTTAAKLTLVIDRSPASAPEHDHNRAATRVVWHDLGRGPTEAGAADKVDRSDRGKPPLPQPSLTHDRCLNLRHALPRRASC
jgi:hypothetical protein